MAALTSSIASFLVVCIAYALYVVFVGPHVPAAADTVVNLLVVPAAFGIASATTLGLSPLRLGIAAVVAFLTPYALGGPGDPAKPGLGILGSIIMMVVSVSAAAIVGYMWKWKRQRHAANDKP